MQGRLWRLLSPEGGWRGAWLLPFIHVLVELGEASIREIADRLGVRTVLVKSALYTLRRFGVVEKLGEGEGVRYRLVDGVVDEYRSMFKRVVLSGDYAAFTGSHYIYVDVKKSRVSYWVLPAHIVERVVEAWRRNPSARPSEIGRALKLHGRTVSRAIRVYKLLYGASGEASR